MDKKLIKTLKEMNTALNKHIDVLNENNSILSNEITELKDKISILNVDDGELRHYKIFVYTQLYQILKQEIQCHENKEIIEQFLETNFYPKINSLFLSLNSLG